ncbi:hypothetical protein M409DRAFT_22230 [Zasmidium cellare ATCC 36951]|uniref:Aromatic amino acid beta-eliminating lyase/threonine aldolase domain-containing protein n=1 Tax=Zasmidium cellare ATCC 36951 TaxID=1080233 RepID=A0A6A6CK54_ZASCE|nr:uncharacterized protein M409DRAFT_22230 [Zasmidium cellare ATCC 36951]KAF2167421.1 hypothetical protein M409DRAFT_22230 [Zasmidium cellare ATCC 36951]
MNFGSDNWAGAHPEIAAGLTQHAAGFAKPYGESDIDATIEESLKTAFEHDLSAFFVATGTAANSLALTAVSKPGGIVFAHREAHIVVDECGAPEYLSGQLRICQIDGEQGKMNPKALRKEVERIASYDVHGGRPVAISITNPTESGTVYTLAEIDQISVIAKEFHLPLHMDGARFANGLVSQDCTPAEMTWKRGVDILSFGATKNGCWCAEAVLFFNKPLAQDFRFLRKRAAQLFSKSRFVSAQLEAYLKDDLWLQIARHSNSMCREVAALFEKREGMRVVRTPQANELFVVMKAEDAERLEKDGVVFLQWPEAGMGEVKKGEVVGRFVTSFATTGESVRALGKCLGVEAGKGTVTNGVNGH